MTVNNIVADFTADTTADAKWYRYGTGTALNTPDPETTNGEFTLFTCGEDSLMVVLSGSISCERRVMPLNVAAANIKIDTILACSAYAWKPTNDHTEILDEPGFYSYSPEGEDCDSTKAIELFFSTPLETTLAKQDACMDSYWSKYGHNIGFLKATVIGGGFSTEHTSTEYTYEWSRANGTIDNESFIAGHPDSLRYLSSDTYYLTTTDINAPLCQAHDTILVDEYSFNYLVTKWGNCVDTDDGWIELVIRQFEFNRDGSPYKIEYWDSNHVSKGVHWIQALNPPDESGVPKGYDTLSNLANGLYYMTITDSLGCYQDKQIKVNDPINPKMTLRAKGLKKVYDGIPVSLNSINVVEYDDNWKVPERAEYYVTSDQWRQLALRIGDSLIVSLLKPDTMIKDVDSVRNIIDGWSIKDAETGKDKTCLYHFYPIDSCIVIVPATLTLFTGSATKEYDGTELINHNWNVQGLENGERVWCSPPTGSQTDVGSSPNTCSIDWGNPGPWGENIAQQKNYTVINHFGTLTVTKNTQPIILTVKSATKKYDGIALTNDTVVATGLPDGFYVEATTSGSQTDVGTSANEVTSYVIKNANGETKTGNFANVTTVAGTLTVEPTDLFITTPSASKPYDGTALTAAFDPSTGAGSISGLASNESITVTTTGSQTEVGESANTYTIDWGTTNPNNYEISDNLGVLTIVDDTLIVVGTLETVTVNGCTASDAPAPYTTVEGLESAGLTIQGDCPGDLHISSHDVHTGAACSSVTRYYTISDGCSDSVTVSQVINITHNEAPHEVGEPVPTSSEVYCYVDEIIPPHENSNIAMPMVVDTCGNVLEPGEPTLSNNYQSSSCTGDFTYNYTYQDCAGKVFQWYYTYHVLPSQLHFTDNGLTDVTLGNACYSADVTSHLKTNGDVWNMYSTDCNNIHSLSVTSEDVVESASNCSWKVTRTFTITNGCVTETKTQSVSGGNTTAPTFAAPNNITVFRNLDSTYDIDPAVTGTVSNVSATCSTADTTYQDSAPATNPDGSLTIVRSWTMTDTCQNATTKEQTITVKPASVTVTITGNTASKTYNGSEQSVTGYTVNIPTGTTLTENDIVGPEAMARGTNVTSENGGKYMMGLTAEQFSATNTNYDVSFDVTDGWLKITKKSISISLDSSKVYDGEIFTVTADQLHVTGLVEGQSLSGQLWTSSAAPGVYVSHDGSSQAFMETGTIEKSLFVLDATSSNVTSSYAPAFDVTLLIEQNLAECSRMEFYGHIYDAVRIGIQCWFAENLRRTIGNYKAFGEDDANVEKFGYLYSWYTAMGVPENDNNAVPATQIGYDGEPYVQGICPDGWAVANEADFALLNATAGGTELLKDPGTLYWINGHEGTVPNTGFNARANGHFNSVSQRYEDQLTGSYFWMPGTNTSTFNSAVIQYYCNEGLFSNHPKTDLQGVRCIRKIAQ